jgi:hypothetical protein
MCSSMANFAFILWHDWEVIDRLETELAINQKLRTVFLSVVRDSSDAEVEERLAALRESLASAWQ